MSIEKAKLINRSTLDERAYFESLIEAACRVGLFSDKEIEYIQDGCLEILSHILKRIYGGYSDSVSENKAQSIMDSIVYTVGLGLKTYRDADEAAILLGKKGVNAIYMRGINRINEMLAAIKEMLDALTQNMPDEPNPVYYFTVTKTLPLFLKKYNPEIAAQECVVYPDYPVDFPIEKYIGVEYIFAYTASLLKES